MLAMLVNHKHFLAVVWMNT